MEQYTVGMAASKEREITEEVIIQYAEMSGDYNAIHLDNKFAAKTIFGRCIAHGGIATALISNLLGNTLPGSGCVFMRQELQYKRPLYVGDTASAEVVIREIMPEKRRILLDTTVSNQNGDVILAGTALMSIQ